MKKFVSIFTILLFSTACLNAQNGVKSTDAAATPSASAAEIQFDTDVHDFGVIKFAGNGTYEFKFKNTGKEPLIITDAKGSCGCTVPTYPKNTPINPGNFQKIKVTYDTKRPGNFTKTVTVYSNAKTPEKTITIKGFVEPEVVEETFPTNGKRATGPVSVGKN
jgi:archaellum component FlaG (FlaF/FlaG flagellin family)